MSVRLRIVGWQVQPVVMTDDGENLEPVDVPAVMIPAARWQEFKDDGGDEQIIGVIRQRIEPEPAAAVAEETQGGEE